MCQVVNSINQLVTCTHVSIMSVCICILYITILTCLVFSLPYLSTRERERERTKLVDYASVHLSDCLTLSSSFLRCSCCCLASSLTSSSLLWSSFFSSSSVASRTSSSRTVDKVHTVIVHTQICPLWYGLIRKIIATTFRFVYLYKYTQLYKCLLS